MKMLTAAALAASMIAISATPSNAFFDLGTDPTTDFAITGIQPNGTNFTTTYQLELTQGAQFTSGIIDISAKLTSFQIQLSTQPGGSPIIASGTGTGAIVQTASLQYIDNVFGTSTFYLTLSGTDPHGGPSGIPNGFTVSGDTLTTTPGGAAPSAPEPATWAMMGIGFACLGFLAYRRRGNQAGFRLA
ncbi:PEP-CTERM sorting domain-containing protein [Bradyrhizobium sp.]|jgi:hypothetical protein|uniref:PEP-CTERM sorting domain-containing protein n=1 Tax=Bradyrhizobium sp. TaxID=376 RepID=UPI003C22FB0E